MIQNYIKYYICMSLFDQTARLHRQQSTVASQRQGRTARQILKESITHSEINCDVATKNSNNFHDLYDSLRNPLSVFLLWQPKECGVLEFLATETYLAFYQIWRCISVALLRGRRIWGRQDHLCSSGSSVACYEKCWSVVFSTPALQVCPNGVTIFTVQFFQESQTVWRDVLMKGGEVVMTIACGSWEGRGDDWEHKNLNQS